LGVLYGEEQLTTVLARTFSPATGLAFMVVQMLFVPCVGTVAAVRQETRSWGWTLFDVGLMAVVSWLVGWGVFLLSRAVGL